MRSFLVSIFFYVSLVAIYYRPRPDRTARRYQVSLNASWMNVLVIVSISSKRKMSQLFLLLRNFWISCVLRYLCMWLRWLSPTAASGISLTSSAIGTKALARLCSARKPSVNRVISDAQLRRALLFRMLSDWQDHSWHQHVLPDRRWKIAAVEAE